MATGSDCELRRAVTRIVRETPVFDVHTHLYDARFGDLLLSGIDDLLTYHYLVAEAFRSGGLNAEDFFGLSKRRRADIIWRKLFVEASPLSESTRGVLTTLKLLGLDPAGRDLDEHRARLEGTSVHDRIDAVFHAAGVETVVMTNDPFNDAERAVWERNEPGDPRFKAALRVDGLVNDWPGARTRLAAWGYSVRGTPEEAGREVLRFLNEWVDRIAPVYLAVTLPPRFDVSDQSERARLIQGYVLPVCRRRNLPLAMMIGVRRGVNPRLRLAGDGVGKASIESVEKLCAGYPDIRFLVTMLSRENQHELCVAARKFANLMPFGCWWFLNDPLTIEEITRMRLELLGTTFIVQHSDARVLEQLIYKWAHTRAVVADVLADKYRQLGETGWHASKDEIRRDVRDLFGGNFRRFVTMGPP